MPKVLIIDDDVAFCSLLKTFLRKNNFETEEQHTGKEGIRAVYENNFDIVLIDFRLPDLDGLDLLKNIKKKYFHMPVIIMTNYANIKTAVKAMQLGAFEYVTKPINPDEILLSISSALEAAKEKQEDKQNAAPGKRGGTKTLSFVQGKSSSAHHVQKHIGLVAPTNLSVIVQGESGTGKEYVSRMIHQQSVRRNKPFVALDCGALSEELAGSELFGHVRGAFTGAMHDKAGEFQAANGGTLFLDEIGNLSYEIQIKLLRAIQERVIRQIGSNKDIPVDVRLIVATNEDLGEAVKKGDFREDLYHRLNEFQIKVPALRERPEDIPIFAEHFLDLANQELNKDIQGFEPEVMEKFQCYNWPGNIRELKNVIKRAVLLSTSDWVVIDSLPPEIVTPITQSIMQQSASGKDEADLKVVKHKTEKAIIEETLIKVKFNKTLAAKVLNIDRKTLYNKIRRYNLDI